METLLRALKDQFSKMEKTGMLFRSKISGAETWEIYINSFEAKYNPVFRDPNSTVHNCNNCKNFIRRYGNIVAVDKDFNIFTMWDIETEEEYSAPVKALSNFLKSNPIENVFFETFNELSSLPYESCKKNQTTFKLGVSTNVKRYTKEEAEKYGVVKPNQIVVFNHLYLDLGTSFVDKTGASIETIMASYRDAKNIFQRTMEEISIDTLHLVKDLIIQESLLDGTSHLHKVEAIIPLKKEYDSVSKSKRDNWLWVNSYNFKFSRFKNELIGVLCSSLSAGEELNEACKLWNKRVDPVNYMKAKSPITKNQIEQAKRFVEDNGFIESFNRRLATIDDIKASEILHINAGKGSLNSVSIFDSVKSTSTKHKKNEFNNVEEVPIDKFMKNILPNCDSVEVLLQNHHEENMVSLTTSNVKDSKPIFKWDNNYSWTFKGNIAGKSMIKDAVKEKGGQVDGVLRFSIMWGENDPTDNSDLDAWASEPNGNTIGFNTLFRKDRGNQRSPMSGQLDVDITTPNYHSNKNIVENIVWEDITKMKDGIYSFWINQYHNRGSKGFKAEIEVGGEIFNYEYNNPVAGNVRVAYVTLSKGKFSIHHHLPEKQYSKEIYGLSTNSFQKVNLICLSPNHWGINNVGNKFYFFMLENAKITLPIRSFHSENLIPELAAHRKVLEVLANTTMINPTDEQLTGLGFNSTVRDELIVKLSGTFKRVIKIKF